MSTYTGWYLKAWLDCHTYLVDAFVQSNSDKEPKINKDPFSYIGDNKLSDNTAVKNTAMSFYQLMIVIGVIGVMVSLTLIGYKLMFSKSGSENGEAKKNIITKLIIAIGVFGFVGILGMIFEITKSLA